MYDENAVSQNAVVSSYPTSRGCEDRSNEALVSKEMNISSTHVDFMFGTSDLSCIGTDSDGNEHVIMENGEILL